MFDFTLSNNNILDFFTGKSDTAPVNEFKYLHSHPMIRPNFLTEIEDLLKQACEKLQGANLNQDAFIPLLSEHGRILGTNIEDFEGKAETILNSMKVLYQFSKQVIDQDI